MLPLRSRIALLSSCIARGSVSVLSVFCRSLLPTSAYLVVIPGTVLAEGFSLLSGSQVVTCPSNVTSGQYVVTRESVLEKPFEFII